MGQDEVTESLEAIQAHLNSFEIDDDPKVAYFKGHMALTHLYTMKIDGRLGKATLEQRENLDKMLKEHEKQIEYLQSLDYKDRVRADALKVSEFKYQLGYEQLDKVDVKEVSDTNLLGDRLL